MKVNIFNILFGVGTLFPVFGWSQQTKATSAVHVADSTGIKFLDIVGKGQQVSLEDLGLYAKGDKYYMTVPKKLLNRPVITFSRVVKSFFGSGYQSDDLVGEPTAFKWLLEGKNMVMYQDNYKILSLDSSASIYQAVASVNRPKKLSAYPVVARSSDGNIIIIEVTNLLLGTELLSFSTKKIDNIAINNDIIALEATRNLPAPPAPKKPTSLRLGNRALYVDEPGKGGDAVVKTVFRVLSEKPMELRFADDRVGYQTITFQDFGGYNQQVRDRKVALRWKMSTKEPLLVYIDPLTPKKWVPYIVKGVEAWQEPFGKIGFTKAIQTKVVPANDTTNILQSASLAISYGLRPVNEKGFSTVVDPRSGEILQAHIGFDHNSIAEMEADYRLKAGINDAGARVAELPEELTGLLIQTKITQQVGLALGLDYNLIASSSYPVDSLRHSDWLAGYGTTASVMDIGGINYVAQPQDKLKREYLFPKVGLYDFWAIAWGYSPSIPNSASSDLNQSLQKWTASQQANTKLRWETNIEGNSMSTRGTDPRIQADDLGDNSIVASNYGLQNLQRTVKELPSWISSNNATALEDLYNRLFSEEGIYTSYIKNVLALIGGEYKGLPPQINRASRNNSMLVPKQVQKEAMVFLYEQFFKTPSWIMDRTVIENMGETGLSRIQQLQKAVLKSLVEEKTEVLSRQEMLFGSDIYTISEMLTDLQGLIIPASSRDDKLDLYQRILQSNYVDVLLEYKEKNGRGTASSQIGVLLSQLKTEIDGRIAKVTDPETKAHYVGLLYNLNK